jgi:hypothetical protein
LTSMGAHSPRGEQQPLERFPGAPDTLRDLYKLYCEHEARELVQMLPSEGRRQLLRQLSDAGGLPSIPRLIELAGNLLPLPSYDVWLDSYLSRRETYLERLGIPSAPGRTEPVTVAVRPVAGRWWAHLNLRQDGLLWLGFITFHPEAAMADGSHTPIGSPLATTDIFRSEDVQEIRERFLGFGDATMQGFLRSVTP